MFLILQIYSQWPKVCITNNNLILQASAAGVTVVNPQPIRLGSPIRSSNLDPIQEMSAPSASKHHSKRPTSSLPLNGGMPVSSSVGGSVGISGSVGQVNNNNNKNNGPVQRVRRESLGSAGGGGRSRPTTPSGRDVRALNLNNLSKSHPTVEMPTEQASPVDLMNSMDKKVRPKSFWASWWRF